MTAENFDVVVVGAGYSGATTARDLGDRGHSVLLLEATDHVGGRAWTRPFRGDPEFSEPIEVGGMWVHLGLQPAVAAEVSRYGIELADSAELEPSGVLHWRRCARFRSRMTTCCSTRAPSCAVGGHGSRPGIQGRDRPLNLTAEGHSCVMYDVCCTNGVVQTPVLPSGAVQ
jgi:hypothetical protein